MEVTPRSLLPLLLGWAALIAPACFLAPTPPCVGDAVPWNVPLDQDGDGTVETVCVGDWDGDGQLETQDVQQAIDALVAEGPTARHVIVAAPGTYAPPPGIPWYRSEGLVALPSDTVLECLPDVVLRGFAPEAYTGAGDAVTAVVINDGFSGPGNAHITVSGCTIHGGKDSAYGPLPGEPSVRLDSGIAMIGVDDVQLLDNRISWTNHACIYTSNITGSLLRGNALDSCGGRLKANGGFPGHYLYVTADPGSAGSPAAGRDVTRDVRIEANVCTDVAGACLNTRKQSAQSVMEEIHWVDNVSSGSGAVASLQGIRHGSFTGHRAQGDRDGISVGGGVDLAFPSAAPGLNNVFDFEIADLVLRDLTGTAGGALGLAGNSEDVRVRDVRVEGTASRMACFLFNHPIRFLDVDGLTLSHCGGSGLNTSQVSGPPLPPEEAPVLRNVTIDCVDADERSDTVYRAGWFLDARIEGLHVAGLSIRGASGPGIQLGNGIALENQLWEDVNIDSKPCGYLGAFSEAEALARVCDASSEGEWLVSVDGSDPGSGDCDFQSGRGVHESACRCIAEAGGYRFAPMQWDAKAAALELGKAPSRGSVFRRWTIEDPSDDAIDLSGVPHRDLVFEAITGSLAARGSLASAVDLLQLGEATTDVSAEAVSCQAAGPEHVFAACLGGHSTPPSQLRRVAARLELALDPLPPAVATGTGVAKVSGFGTALEALALFPGVAAGDATLPASGSAAALRVAFAAGAAQLAFSSESGAAGGGTLPLPGSLKLCLYAADCTGGALTLPLTSSGDGVGRGPGMLSATAGASRTATLRGDRFTLGTASVTTPSGSATRAGSVHGPLSGTSLASAGASGATLQLVSPIAIHSNVGPLDAGGFATITLTLLPEPDPRLAAAAALLALAGLTRLRRARDQGRS